MYSLYATCRIAVGAALCVCPEMERILILGQTHRSALTYGDNQIATPF